MAAELDPSSARLTALQQRSETAQNAFAALRSQLVATGAEELAADLEGRFHVLWEDLDRAIVASQGRRESLAAIRARLQSVTSRHADARGSGAIIVPLLQQE